MGSVYDFKCRGSPTIVDIENQEFLSRPKWCDEINLELSGHLLHFPDIAHIVLVAIAGSNIHGEVDVQVIHDIREVLQF